MKAKGIKNGFSMIEVLVATSILIVIVMMLAMLFQQTSVAWRTGLLRAQGFMQLRSYIGAIQRDVAGAIDARNIPEALLYSKDAPIQDFQGDPIRFYTLTGDETARSLSYIEYSEGGVRMQWDLLPAHGKPTWQPRKGSGADVSKSSAGSEDDGVVAPQGFVPVFLEKSPASDAFPLYIKVKAKITQKGKLYQVGAASAGPDKTWDTKDDIRTWVE